MNSKANLPRRSTAPVLCVVEEPIEPDCPISAKIDPKDLTRVASMNDILEPRATATIEPQDFTPANFTGLEVAKELLQRLKSSDRDNQSPKHVQIPDVLRLQARVMRDTHVQEHSCQEGLKIL